MLVDVEWGLVWRSTSPAEGMSQSFLSHQHHPRRFPEQFPNLSLKWEIDEFLISSLKRIIWGLGKGAHVLAYIRTPAWRQSHVANCGAASTSPGYFEFWKTCLLLADSVLVSFNFSSYLTHFQHLWVCGTIKGGSKALEGHQSSFIFLGT